MTALTLIGGPTVLLDYGGLRWLTDPTFSPPGEYAGGLLKTVGPARQPDELGPIDVILVSHDQHSDNLDPAGRELLPHAERVLTTSEGAQRLGLPNVRGLQPWETVTVERHDGQAAVVTAVPAQHGPPGSESVSGPVLGFVLSAEDLPTVYVSGDNASRELVRTVAGRVGAVDIALLFAGAVQLPHRFDGAYLTLSSDHAAEAAEILDARIAVPVHYDGWAHFTQGADRLRAAFAGNAQSERLLILEPGVTVEV